MAGDDIVTRLRDYHATVSEAPPYYRELTQAAADEIERLRAERDALFVLTDRLTAERDEARQEVCFLLSRNVTQGCDGDTPEFHATARGWCYLLEEDTNG